MIRALIAAGSPFQANFISRALTDSGVGQSVGVARNGEEAILLTHRLKPDVIVMDAELPVLRVALATRHIMEHAPCPILVTAEPDSHAESLAFVALDEGAVDLLPRGSSADPISPSARRLVKRIEVAARSCIPAASCRRPAPTAVNASKLSSPPLVLMGGAVGGIQATTDILRRLPSSFPGSVCLVQHLAPDFLAGYARWLESQTGLRVEICRGTQPLGPRTVYLSPPGAHLVLDGPDSVAPERGPMIGGHRPSVTTLFRSAASLRPATTCAVVLSGEGRDGVEGVRRMAKRGGTVFVQRPETCLVPDMPRHALRAHPESFALTPAEIAQKLAIG